MSACSIEGCSKNAKAGGLCSMHYARNRDGRDLTAPNRREIGYDDLFLLHVGPVQSNGCRLWIGGTDSDGYGLFTAKGKPTVRAHRYAYERVNGPLGDSMACHACDTPGCVEAGHLFPGTAIINSTDMVDKCRSARPAGEAHPMARLKHSDIAAIRADSRPRKDVAASFGISIGHVYAIRAGARW